MKNIFGTLLCHHEYQDVFSTKIVKNSILKYTCCNKYVCVKCGKEKYVPAKEQEFFTL